MGRNIDLDEMIKETQTKCYNCGALNKGKFEEFDIDCFEFDQGECNFEFDCENCGNRNAIKIIINIQRCA